MYERSKDLGLLEAARQQIAEIDEAQEAIRREATGSAKAAASTSPRSGFWPCPDCPLRAVQEGAGNGGTNGTPVEEEALRRPPEAGLRGRLDYAFDREAAWEEVAEFGTSSSRQGIPSQIQNNIGREKGKGLCR